MATGVALEASTAPSVLFTVYGKPAPMGSKRAFVSKKTGRAILTDDNSKARQQWANAVSAAAAEAMEGRELHRGAVSLMVTFYFSRPNSHFGSGKNAHTIKQSAPEYHSQQPDLDKLVRALNDALSGIVFHDDRQVVHLSASKEWTTEQQRAVVCAFFDPNQKE